jgi:SOS-response transcriptional repressor LexA
MQSPRLWVAHLAAVEDTQPAPPVGSFHRGDDGSIRMYSAPAPAMPPRELGTDPTLAVTAPRARNSANRGVYTIHLDALRARRQRAGAGVRVPVTGEIAAGRYDVTVAFRDYLDYEHGIELERALVRAGSGAYALRVRGTSMTHVGIEPGDLVVVQPQDSDYNGDFVVARLADSTDPEGYVTLKRFYRRQDHIFLQSATADKDPIRLFPQAGGNGRTDRDQVKIQGKVVVVIKTRQ